MAEKPEKPAVERKEVIVWRTARFLPACKILPALTPLGDTASPTSITQANSVGCSGLPSHFRSEPKASRKYASSKERGKPISSLAGLLERKIPAGQQLAHDLWVGLDNRE